MPSAALVQLESLLSTRKLDHTLSSRLPAVGNEHGLAPTGLVSLDDQLAGGLPRGQISEIVAPRSSGRQTMLVSWLAAATARGELTALVDPLDMFDPPSAAAHGLDLSRVLWVRGRALGPARVSLPSEVGELRVQVERAVKALNLILQANGFGLVALDLGEVPLSVVGRLPFTTWRRLHRVIEGGETACVVVASEPVARSVGGITLALDSHQPSAISRQPVEPFTAADAKVASSAASASAALKNVPRHPRLFPALKIAGRAIHARGTRTDRIALTAD